MRILCACNYIGNACRFLFRCWYDASSDNMNHSELVDAFGDYKGRTAELEVSSANTWFDTVTPDQYTRVQLEEATIVCSEHAYRVHPFGNDNFNAVLLVNDTDLVDTTGPATEDDDARSNQDMSNTEPDTDDDDNADARSRIFKVQDPDYDKFCPLFGWMNTKTIKKTFEQTTQYARMPNGTILKKHYKSPFRLSMCNIAMNASQEIQSIPTLLTLTGVRPVPRSLSTWKPWLQTSMV